MDVKAFDNLIHAERMLILSALVTHKWRCDEIAKDPNERPSIRAVTAVEAQRADDLIRKLNG